jgi:hypothetical protein
MATSLSSSAASRAELTKPAVARLEQMRVCAKRATLHSSRQVEATDKKRSGSHVRAARGMSDDPRLKTRCSSRSSTFEHSAFTAQNVDDPRIRTSPAAITS